MSDARLDALAVRDFRNLQRVELEVPPEGLVLVGENGQGKTNLLEAIAYLELLRSVRGARDADLARFGAEAFHVRARLTTDRDHEMSVGFERAGKRKRVTVDGEVHARLSDALGVLPAVMFSPADVELIAGAPAARRRYLDIMLALNSRPYLAALQRYRGALARRNAALRDAARTGRTDQRVAVWEEPLAESGAVLWRERQAWVEAVAARFSELCAAIGEQARVALRYASTLAPDDDANVAEALLRALADKRALDVRRGLTHVGPHRDELAITIAGDDGAARELRAFGSAGQQRTAAIVLRMLEAETFRASRGGAPVFLLDDPFAELDVRRAARILALLHDSGLGQTILAVPRESDIPAGMDRLPRLRVRAGQLHAWSPDDTEGGRA